MDKRYTIQVITPNGNLLGSIKIHPLLMGRMLGGIETEYSKQLNYLANTEFNTLEGLSDKQRRTRISYERTRAKVKEMSKQIDWALHNAEVL